MGVSPDYILNDISYQNLIMYGCAAPHYDDVENEWDESLDANDPTNFSSNDEEVFVR